MGGLELRLPVGSRGAGFRWSCRGQGEQAGLRGNTVFAERRWSVERVVKESPKVSIDQELMPEQRHEPAQVPLQPTALLIPYQQ